MSRLMPGRVRQEGIELYETGQLFVQTVENQTVHLTVAGADFVYSLKDEEISCSCETFAQKHYCKHLAAVEYFLKNDISGKEYAEELKKEGHQVLARQQRAYFGGIFLDRILPKNEDLEVKYHLSVEGQLLLFDQNIDWTLKISRLPDQRCYIIRDIGAFLKTVKRRSSYQIGKNYYERLSLSSFDEASQDLIAFLWSLVPEKSVLESEVLVHFGRHLRLPLAYLEEGLSMLQALSDFTFSYDGREYQEILLSPFDASAGLYHVKVEVEQAFMTLLIEEKDKRSLFHGAYFLKENHLYQVLPQQETLLKAIQDISSIEGIYKTVQLDLEDRDRLALSLLEFQAIATIEAPKNFIIQDFKPIFSISRATSGNLELKLTLQFPQNKACSKEELDNLPFATHPYHLKQVLSAIQKAGFHGQFEAVHAPLETNQIYPFFAQTLASLRRLGRVELSDDLENLVIESRPQVSLSASGSLLDVNFDFAGIAQDEVDAALRALLSEEQYFTTQTGKVLVFDDETKKISQTLAHLRATYDGQGHLKLDRLAAYQLSQDFENHAGVTFTESFQELAHDLTHPEEYILPDLPIRAELRDYQELGIKWFSTLHKYGFGGILADDMGLGKTLQTIAFLAGVLEKDSRVLILSPSSLIYNWQEEFHKFAPHLDVSVIYGHKAEREEQLAQGSQIVVTSYASFRQDSELYQTASYQYLILDEAQVMKNAQTKIAQLLRDFEVDHCFALSGTPIENHLGEIWSIFQIVMPGLLPQKTAFGKLSAQEVSRIIRPFVLRRKKEDVLAELPDLIEVNVLNELSDEQKAIYLAQLKQMQENIVHSSDAQINRQKIEILSGITRLRQICDTPKLFMEDYKGPSGKLDSLKDLLIQLKEGNHRVLIFSQFRQMLDLIEEELEELQLTSYKLTGSTPAHQRQQMTRAFNTGSRDAFLISLKAGGVGLNLTGADTVILVDLWWNPATEAQAISRAHRMGQTETVEFYRLITRGTIEEKIQELQESKKNLVTTVLDGNESRASMTVEEIREILGIS